MANFYTWSVELLWAATCQILLKSVKICDRESGAQVKICHNYNMIRKRIHQFFKTEFNYFILLMFLDLGTESKSAVRKFTYAIYVYPLMQFFIASETAYKNPKYFISLFGFKKVARWKLIPFGIFESFMSFSGGSLLLIYVIFFLIYVKTNLSLLESLK